MIHQFFQDIATSAARISSERLDMLTTRDEISNDSLEVWSKEGVCYRFRSPVGFVSGTSGGALTEIACLYGMDFTRILTGRALTGILFIGTAFTGISFSIRNTVFSSKGSRPPGSVECTEFLILNRTSDHTRETCRRNFAEGLLGSALLVCAFTFGLCANVISATDRSALELRPAERRFLGTSCLHASCRNFSNISVQFSTDGNPDFVASPPKESSCRTVHVEMNSLLRG